MEQRSFIELSDDEIILYACSVMEARYSYKTEGEPFADNDVAKRFFHLKLAGREREVVAVAFLNSRNRLIRYEELFLGTIDGASVHVREVAKRALELNAVALLIAHNHPSGDPSPSTADQNITAKLRDALALFDIRILDHVIVGATRCESLAALRLI